ncbi:MAG: hypothetical protein ACRDPY_15210 [Streptosporangiaceae bacterium]
MIEPYKRPTREDIEARIRAREADRAAMMGGAGWDPLGRRELEELDPDPPAPAPQPEPKLEPDPEPVPHCRKCGYLVTAIGHKVRCGG